jgi:hypothetical protein
MLAAGFVWRVQHAVFIASKMHLAAAAGRRLVGQA